MTLSNLQTYARNLTLTDSTSYPDASLNLSINRWYHTATGIMLDVADDWNPQDNSSTINTAADVQSYSVPGGALTILRVEVNPQIYGGASNQPWKKAYPLDLAEYSGGNDTTSIAANFSAAKPYYSIRGGKLYLYPIPTAAITDGVKIWYGSEETELSQASDEPNIAEPFQKILALGAAYDYALANELSSREALKRDLNQLIDEMKIFYGRRQKDRQMTMKSAYLSYK